MKLQPLQEIKTRSLPFPNLLKFWPLDQNIPNEKQESLEATIKTQPGYNDSKTVLLYLKILKTSFYEALLNPLVLLKKSQGPESQYGTPKLHDYQEPPHRIITSGFLQKSRASGN